MVLHTTTLGDSVQPVEQPVIALEKPDLFPFCLASFSSAANNLIGNTHEALKAPQVASCIY